MKRFSGLLDVLIADCPADTRRRLADLTVRGVGSLRQSGIPATPTEVLGGVLGAVDIGSTDACAPFFRRYIALRRKEGS